MGSTDDENRTRCVVNDLGRDRAQVQARKSTVPADPTMTRSASLAASSMADAAESA
ncbi:hypothetical protein [Arthrobacter methylotrophus]|uniref:hypothetical protein n=1 Tax=Arthrobacter methylotrophus TaxID=121291 RepID=UPI003CD0C092